MIDFSSDVKTLPSAAMRQAMASAEVGDEQAFEDPTVNALCARVAALLGKEAALFAPSGCMCNQIAIASWCRPGEEVIADRSAHIAWFESGGPAANAGVMLNTLDGDRGRFDLAQLQAALRPRWRHCPLPTLLAVEQTCNLGGGAVWPLPQLQAVAAFAHSEGMHTHMDGARLLNAVIASGVAASDYAAPFDSVWLDLSKGLGAPIGAVLAGSREFIERAWGVKQRLGGAMRQAGILAAAGLYALDHNVERLRLDHQNARALALGLSQIGGLMIDPTTIETNLVFFDVDAQVLGFDAATFASRLAALGYKMGPFDARRVRAVTHLDISAENVQQALAAVAKVCAG
ncbi:MAG: low specificity L-threonine aldolase [Lysobacterales bacterium CG02_land_8_20_14_3_00_62_12]|nr:MAG: low specificity L-threonine aldolase [Xanthomonadales bacterium CG02_land_8_20_14_3_00_62_12]